MPALDNFFLPGIGSGFRGALVKVPADLVDTVRETCLKSLRDGDSTELDATTLIGAGRRLT
ncbi:hypothetical protein PV646_17430 [Streptomyces sp. ID05-26A]|nr:hypothetical protein [Streptomyces sp. ID05-26A]